MYEIIIKCYVFLSTERITYFEANGVFHTERLANTFLMEQLARIPKMTHDDIQIDIRFFERKE